MKKTKKMLSIIMTAVLLFVAYSAATPPLGPGLSQAADLNATTASPTDISLMPIEPEENSVTAITVNPNVVAQNNIAVKVVVNNSNIDRCTWRVTLTTGLKFYGFRPGDISAERANGLISTSGTYIYLDIVSSDNFTQGTHLVTLYFTADITVSNPQTAWYNTVLSCVSDTGASIPNPFVLTYALLGDANLSGGIDAQDSIWIQRYVGNSLSNSDIINIERQCLAADVDLDGTVSISDNLDVLKRTTGKIKSFLDINRIYLPYGTTACGVACQIKNVQTNRYLTRTSNDTVGLWNSNSSNNCLFRFEKVNSNYCLYRIISVANDQELCLDTNNNLVLIDSGVEIKPASNQWYVIPYGSKYYIINFREDFLTLGDLGKTSTLSICGVSYLDYGNVWEVVPYVNLKLYYDGAYASRHQNSSLSQVSQELAGYRDEIAAILEANFNIDVKTSFTPVSHTSLLDTMTASHSKETYCACSGTNNEICKQYRSSSSAPGTGVHHNNYVYQLYHFRNAKANSLDYHLLYSGYKNCGGYMNENNVLAHTTYAVAGVANTNGDQVSMVFYTGDDVFYYKKHAALHEVCHTLGAIVDKEELTPDTEHGDCVMSYDRNVGLMKRYWDNDDYTSLLCKDCRYLINSYLHGRYYADKIYDSEE